MLKSEVIERLSEAYFSEECHEKEVLDNLPKLLIGVKVFIDIGASLGQYTFHANKHIKGGRIFAIEADPFRFEELEKNCNNWESASTNKIIPIHAAVSDTDGKTSFFVTKSDVSGGLFIRDVSHKSVEWHEEFVDCFKLDTFFNEQLPDFIKIDVEGAELAVLKGAVNILREGKAKLLIEVHSFSGQINPEEVYGFMRSVGYFPKYFFGRLLFEKSNRHSYFNKIIHKIKDYLSYKQS